MTCFRIASASPRFEDGVDAPVDERLGNDVRNSSRPFRPLNGSLLGRRCGFFLDQLVDVLARSANGAHPVVREVAPLHILFRFVVDISADFTDVLGHISPPYSVKGSDP
jgi:hypothetical protein